MLEVSSLRLRSPPTPCPPSPSGSKTAAATDPPQHELIGFVGGDHGHGHGHAAGFPTSDGGFMDDTDSLLLDYIDFSSCDVVVPFFDADGDVLPDLEADPMELLADFSPCPPDADDDDLITVSPAAPLADNDHEAQPPEEQDQDQDGQPMEAAVVAVEDKKAADEEQRWLLGAHDDINASRISNHEKVVKEGEEEEPAGNLNLLQDHQQPAGPKSSSSAAAADEAGQHHTRSKKKPPPASNASKRKVKVDWTPELHRRFVQAVEQLGIDKAVPSRILEIMGIQCLTRHNIASHLQKYRSHRKHLMAREAEAASWAQKRHMYAAAAAAPTMMRNNSKQHLDVPPPSAAAAGPRPWVVPTIGFPPPAPFCRPLHVWGHPPATCGTAAATVEAAAAAAPPGPGPTMMMPLPVPVWPRHLARPTAAWAVDPAAYWHQHYTAAARKWGPPPQPAAGTPCVPPPMPMPMQLPRFPHPAVPTTMYTRPAAMAPPPPPTTTSKLAELQLPLDAHPSKESIDAAIGDVLVKPWLPLPLGLKPPSLDSVMSELHRHGIPKVPPAAARGEP